MSEENENIKQNDADGSGAPQISAMIDKILANPELISMVASALSSPTSAPASAQETQESAPSDEDTSENTDASVSAAPSAADKLPDLMTALMPALASMKGAGAPKAGHGGDRRSCLLVALKPYLCRERCEAIDYMVKLGKISEIFRNMS